MDLQPQELAEGPCVVETFHDRRAKKRLDIAGGIIQALTIALVLATISTVLKLDKNVCVMDQEYQSHRDTMRTLSATIESHNEKLSKNCNRLTAIESKYVEVVELKLVWEQFAEIKGDLRPYSSVRSFNTTFLFSQVKILKCAITMIRKHMI